MRETIILLLIYLLSGLACLAVAAWTVISGQFFDIDGLFLVHVCLALAAVFLGAFGLAVWKGEFSDAISKIRKPKPAAPEQSGGLPATSPAPNPQQAQQPTPSSE